jgi:hypothetical protein
MSRNVGIYGGNSLYQLGPSNDAAAFFKCLDRFIPEARSGGKFDILTDRLRWKYVRKHELVEAANVLNTIKSRFEAMPNRNIDWHRFGVNEDITILNLSGNNDWLLIRSVF